QVEALEHESDLAVAHVRQLDLAQLRGVASVEQVAAAGRRVQAADDVHQRGLAGTGGADQRHVLVAGDVEVDAGQRQHFLVAHLVAPDDVAQRDHSSSPESRSSSASASSPASSLRCSTRSPSCNWRSIRAGPRTTVSPTSSGSPTACQASSDSPTSIFTLLAAPPSTFHAYCTACLSSPSSVTIASTGSAGSFAPS